MKGICLAGGCGTRLSPLTWAVSKQLLPVHDKPMIYYPLSLLMMAGIRDILIITTPQDKPAFQRLLGSGESFGVRFTFAEQPRPEGLAQAFTIGADFLQGEPSCLVLGDNVLYGAGLGRVLQQAATLSHGALIFGYPVENPSRYGVVTFDTTGKVLSIEEKPENPQSPFAVPGLYFYDGRAPEFARTLRPSQRGELEITDLNRCYLEEGSLRVKVFGRGIAWLDAGTSRSLTDASLFVQTLEERQGLKIACLEEIAWREGWIDQEQLLRRAEEHGQSAYGRYLRMLSRQGEKVRMDSFPVDF